MAPLRRPPDLTRRRRPCSSLGLSFWLVASLVFGLLGWAAPLRAGDVAQEAPSSYANAAEGASSLPPLPEGYGRRSRSGIDMAWGPGLERWAEPLLEEALRFRAAAREQLGPSVLSKATVRLAPDAKAMRQLAPRSGSYPSYAAGVAYSARDLILLTEQPVTPNSEHDVRTVLRHELAHLALADAAPGGDIPLWFNEGLAVVLSGEDRWGRLRALWAATVTGDLLPFPSLERSFPQDTLAVPLAYAQSADFVRYLSRRQDAGRFRLLLKRIARGEPFERAVANSYGEALPTLFVLWQDDAERRYTLLPMLLSGGMLWGLLSLLLVVAWLKKRRRQARTLARWAAQEAAEDARAERERLLQAAPAWLAERLTQGALPSGLPQVREGQQWHTLH